MFNFCAELSGDFSDDEFGKALGLCLGKYSVLLLPSSCNEKPKLTLLWQRLYIPFFFEN